MNKDIILNCNKYVVLSFGGFYAGDNIAKENSFHWLLGMIEDSTYYGKDLYPDAKSKAAYICHFIITRHLFNDGNKRTALACMLTYLKANGWTLSATDESIKSKIVAVAQGRLGEYNFINWVKRNVRLTQPELTPDALKFSIENRVELFKELAFL